MIAAVSSHTPNLKRIPKWMACIWLTLFIIVFGYLSVGAQQFITRWQSSLSSFQAIITKTGPVTYSWTTVPAGQSGSGTVIGASNSIDVSG